MGDGHAFQNSRKRLPPHEIPGPGTKRLCAEPNPENTPEPEENLLVLSTKTSYDDGENADIQILPEEIDVCLGVIIENVKSSWDGKGGPRPVTIKPLGGIMQLSFTDTGVYSGYIDLPILGRLKEEFTIRYSATMVATKPPNRGPEDKPKASAKRTHPYTIRIVVYGLKPEQHTIAHKLSDAGLCLQHPSALEVDPHIEYWNPHYLLRPGSRMPPLEALSLSEVDEDDPVTKPLEEREKDIFMQIFNTACDTGYRPSISPSPRLKSKLEEHQITALAMMIEKERGLVEHTQFPCIWIATKGPGHIRQYRHVVTGLHVPEPTIACGGILADDMGLGKTLSLLSLVCSSLDAIASQERGPQDGSSRATLIVAPKSTLPGWQKQINAHIRDGQIRAAMYHGPDRQKLSSKFWETDVVLTTYSLLRLDWETRGPLYHGKWHRVVLDEAHHIRNRTRKLFRSAYEIDSDRRWCLTGTPIHNSLDDYGALLSFIRVPLVMDKSQFNQHIQAPIREKRPRSLDTLKNLIRCTCLRRTKNTLQLSLQLPRKTERTEKVELHGADRELYEFFRKRTVEIARRLGANKRGSGRSKDENPLAMLNCLRLICDYGERLIPAAAMRAWQSRSTELVDCSVLQSLDGIGTEIEARYPSDDEVSDSGDEISSSSVSTPKTDSRLLMTTLDQQYSPSSFIATGVHSSQVRLSAKAELLIQNLKRERKGTHPNSKVKPAKSVVFSQWVKMLSLVANDLCRHGLKFERIDGSSSLKQRIAALEKFSEDPSCTILLASIGSVGEGVDLTAANYLHLLDPHWNPMVESQAVDRVHRIGQDRDVTVIRYIAQDSIETYIQSVQDYKLRLFSRSMDSTTTATTLILEKTEVDNVGLKKLSEILGSS